MKKIVALLSVLCLMLSLISCKEEVEYSSNIEDSIIGIGTSAEAISIAQESSKVQKEIAEYYSMKFYYTPSWGTCTAKSFIDEFNDCEHWNVVLKGTISGYTDDYKSNFEYDKKFSASVEVCSDGTVVSVYVSRG